MLEECLRILLADLGDRLTERHDESFVDACPGLANEILLNFENASSIGLKSGE
jgi:hypothetical protein